MSLLVSKSSSFVEVLMEMGRSFVDSRVLSYKNSAVNYSDIGKLRASKNLSSIGNEENVILETFEKGWSIFLFRPKGIDEEFFYFYLEVLDVFKIQIPFFNFVPRSNYIQMDGGLLKSSKLFVNY